VTSSLEPRVGPNVRRLPPEGSLKYAALLDAAEERFGAVGFKKANVDDIAAAAGISKPLIYRYFSTKEELYEVVVDRIVTEWCDVVTAQAARATPTAGHSLRLVLTASVEFARSRPVLRGLLAREGQLMLSDYSDVLVRGTATLRAVITAILERGVRDDEIRADLGVQHMAIFLTEVCEAFANRLIAGTDDAGDAGLLEAVVETALYGVVAKPGSAPTRSPDER
jgi:AcrR family transcriptional regulator